MATGSTTRPFRSRALGGSDIGRCLTRLHHDRFTTAPAIPDEVRDRAFADGIAFEAEMLQRLADAAVPVTEIAGTMDEAEAATITAMDDGVPLIARGRLSADGGALVGYPDLLVRLDTGYAAVDIKHHKVMGDKGPTSRRTSLDRIADTRGDETRFRSSRRRDLLQVAHYWRLLDTVGHGSATPIGGIIGTDEPIGCSWVDLIDGDAPIMDEYHAYVTDALRAIEHGLAGEPTPLYRAWMRGECRRCDWLALCTAELEAIDDPTLLRRVDHELRVELAADGVATVEDVAALEPDDDRLPDGSVVLQARARQNGSLLNRGTAGTPTMMPTAAIEVDFDIETYGGTTYLAGLLITEAGTSTYEPIVDWRADGDGERHILSMLFDRLSAWAHEDVIVFHWTDYEEYMISAAADRYGLSVPGFASVEDWFDAHAVDLCEWTRVHLVSPDGYSLKTVAPLCGFAWRDDDPGGLQSEIWFEHLRDGDTDMAHRLLTYNEDDVLAQLAIRRWVRGHDSGAGPGSDLPSALTPPRR